MITIRHAFHTYGSYFRDFQSHPLPDSKRKQNGTSASQSEQQRQLCINFKYVPEPKF